MKYLKQSAATIMLLSTTSFAHAQDDGFYGALGVSTYEFKSYGADIKLGYNMNKNFGVEVQGIVGLSTDSRPISEAEDAATLSIKPEYTIGAFAVGRLPLSENIDLLARGGVHNTRTNIQISNVLGTNVDEDKTGLAAGAGLQYNLDTQNGLRLDYTYLDNNSSDFGTRGQDVISLSFLRKF